MAAFCFSAASSTPAESSLALCAPAALACALSSMLPTVTVRSSMAAACVTVPLASIWEPADICSEPANTSPEERDMPCTMPESRCLISSKDSCIREKSPLYSRAGFAVKSPLDMESSMELMSLIYPARVCFVSVRVFTKLPTSLSGSFPPTSTALRSPALISSAILRALERGDRATLRIITITRTYARGIMTRAVRADTMISAFLSCMLADVDIAAMRSPAGSPFMSFTSLYSTRYSLPLMS